MSTIEVILGHVFCAVGTIVIAFLGIWVIFFLMSNIWERINDLHIVDYPKLLKENRSLKSDLDDMSSYVTKCDELDESNRRLRQAVDKARSERDHYRELVKEQHDIIDCQCRELSKHRIMEEASK